MTCTKDGQVALGFECPLYLPVPKIVPGPSDTERDYKCRR